MIYGLLLTILIVVCFLLVLIILVQQGKSSMGLGSLGGGAQMLFGGSGGQDIFQKITWVLGTIFMGLSFMLALMKSHTSMSSRYLDTMANPVQTEQTAPQPQMPVQESSPSEQ